MRVLWRLPYRTSGGSDGSILLSVIDITGTLFGALGIIVSVISLYTAVSPVLGAVIAALGLLGLIANIIQVTTDCGYNFESAHNAAFSLYSILMESLISYAQTLGLYGIFVSAIATAINRVMHSAILDGQPSCASN